MAVEPEVVVTDKSTQELFAIKVEVPPDTKDSVKKISLLSNKVFI